MALPIGLGSGVFCTLDSNLRLTLNASAEVKLDPDAIDSTEIQPLQSLRSGEIWLTQAPEIKLHLRISVEPGLVHPASTFLSQAGELFRDSKIWSDLGLAVLFKSCEYAYNATDSDSLRLSFGLRRMPGPSSSSRASRLPSSLQGIPEAVPPSGFPTGYLTSFNVSLEYESKEVNSYTPMKLYTTPFSNDDCLRDAFEGLPLSQIQYSRPGKSANTVPDKYTAAAFERELQDSSEDWTTPLHGDLLRWSNDEGYTEEFNKLLDIGFRSLVTCDPAGSSSIATEAMPTPLSELVPTVFSLGFSDAMGQRSQFIPSIAKSMASIIQRKDQATHRRTSGLGPRESKSECQSPKERKIADLRTKIKHSLWRTAQTQLYNPNASRNLSSLNSAFIQDEEWLDYIAEEDADDSNTLLSSEEEDYYLGTDEDDTDFCEGSASIHSDDDLLNFDGGNQDSGSTLGSLEIPLPSASMSNSCLPASSPIWSPTRSFPSESEMLTDPAEASFTDGFHVNDDVGMLCEV